MELLRKWFGKLHPFTGKGRQADYRYQISFYRLSFSLTQVLDRPVTGTGLFRGNYVGKTWIEHARPRQWLVLIAGHLDVP
jgi:hypothetical protein